MAKENHDDDNENVWKFVLLELIPDPAYKDKLCDLEIDEVTWKTYLLRSLKQLHGVFGAAIDTDVIQTKGKKALVRIQKEDFITLKSAIISFVTNLSIFGYDEINGSISLKEVDKDFQL